MESEKKFSEILEEYFNETEKQVETKGVISAAISPLVNMLNDYLTILQKNGAITIKRYPKSSDIKELFEENPNLKKRITTLKSALQK